MSIFYYKHGTHMKKLYNVRRANESDSYYIANINATSWQKAYRDIISDQILDSISIDAWESSWKSQIQNNAIVFVICKENNVVGFSQICKNTLLNIESTQGEINAIYLHPDVWREGLGRDLCLVSLVELKNLGFKEAILWVLSENTRARKFYESIGFKESGATRISNIFSNIALSEIQYIKVCSEEKSQA